MPISRSRDIAGSIGQAVALDKITAAGGLAAGLTVYANIAAMPTSGPSVGDQAFVSANNKIYVWNGSGWFSVATVNQTPTWSTEPDGSYSLAINGTATTITVAATDPDGFPITYGYSASGLGNIATISQSGATFTITPSTNSDHAGTFTVTFTATDGINTLSKAGVEFSLVFKVDNSTYTTHLLKASGNNLTNSSFTDGSSSSHTLTTGGDVRSTGFSPHHPGRYGVHFSAYGHEISFPDNAAYDIGTSQFSAEAWVYPTGGVNNYSCGIISQFASSSRGWGLTFNNTQIKFYGSSNGGSSTNTVHTATYTVPHYEWSHIVATRDTANIRIFVNGNLIYVAANTVHYHNSTQPLRLGEANAGTSENFKGYMRDVRLVTGEVPAAYQTSLTTAGPSVFNPPTEPITAVSGTQLLTCNSFEIKDASSNNATPSYGSTSGPTIARFSPYDFSGYTVANHGASVYFDGNADYITMAHNSDWQLGTGDFTVEAWVYPNAVPGGGVNNDMCVWGHFGSTQTMFFYLSNDTLQPVLWNGSAGHGSSITAKPYQWTHVAWVRSSSTMKTYVNGQLGGTTNSYTTNFNEGTKYPYIGASEYNNRFFNGYISDLRVVKGTAVYTGNFTPPTAPLTAITNTKLLLNPNPGIFDAVNAHPGFTLLGNAKSSTVSKKYAASSMLFDGTGDVVSFVDDTKLDFGDRDFTMEGWYNADATNGDHYIISASGGTFNGHWGINIYQGNWRVGGFNDKLIGGVGSGVNAGMSTGTWHHFAWINANRQILWYINGAQAGDIVDVSSDTFDCSGAFKIGGFHSNNSNNWDGYLEDIRITKGLARYPYDAKPVTLTTTNSGMTKPDATTPTVTASNVTLLTCHAGTAGSQTITDGSSNNTSITVNGNAVVSDFAPKAGMKSVYFDGTGDYLQCTLADTLGTADWTIEYWVYHDTVANNDIHCAFGGYAPAFYYRHGSTAFAMYHSGGISGNHNANITPIAKKWYHKAYVHDDSANTVTVFVNGSVADSFSYTGNISSTTFRIGDDGTSSWMNGYISNLRIVKDTALYTNTFTPQASELLG